jgi:hypothetical protein
MHRGGKKPLSNKPCVLFPRLYEAADPSVPCLYCSLRLLDARASSDALLENCLPKSVISAALSSAEGTSSDVDQQDARGVQHRSFEVHHEATVRAQDYQSSSAYKPPMASPTACCVTIRLLALWCALQVLFVDIVNFTKLSSGMKPADLVSLLHDLVSQIDQLVARYPVEKIKTIGDA